MAVTTYGDISPRTAGKAAKQMLERAQPSMIVEKFGDGKPLPSNSTKTMKFRRYNRLDTTPVELTEGVTPAGKQLTTTDVTVTLKQYGDHVGITDVIADTHEDPVLSEAIDVIAEQAPQMLERARVGVLIAGTNVMYANGAARSAVNTSISKGLVRRVVRSLKRQEAPKITRVIRSTPSYGTEAVAASYICMMHSDIESDVRDMDGFVPVEKYGSLSPYDTEIGKLEDVRFVTGSFFTPWEAAGGTVTGDTHLGSKPDGANGAGDPVKADVYPMLVVGQHAYGLVPLKGEHAIKPLVVNPKPAAGDPLGQRGTVGWKAMDQAVILNDAWMVRMEVAAKA